MAGASTETPRFYRCGACKRWLRGKKKPDRCVGCGSRDVYEPYHTTQAILQRRDALLTTGPNGDARLP